MSIPRIEARIRGRIFCLATLAFLLPAAGRSWIYSEHREIAGAGVGKLAPDARESLEAVWTTARGAIPGRLCDRLFAGDQGTKPDCIDFAAWAAIAGDHSCSPRELVRGVVPGKWILNVAAVAADTTIALRKASGRTERLNQIASMNLALQAADAEYTSRAGANNAHFLLPREGDGAAAYMRAVLKEGAPLNALGLYLQYHLAALAAASQLASGGAEAVDVLALEGYALHWLEDSYAAGHVVGTWGGLAWRKGTHDYYSEFGIDTLDLKGQPFIDFGDANMRPADLERASSAV